jgi:nucleotide-binding universal stress UspA family protein
MSATSKVILVGYDPGRADRAPLDFGIAAAEFTGARLIVAAVQGSPPNLHRANAGIVDAKLKEGRGVSLDRLADELRQQGIDADCQSLTGTSAASALHEAAEELGAGLLVVGSTERAGIGRVLPGSTAQRLMHGAPCPIAVVPRAWQRGDGLRTIGVGYVDTAEGHHALGSAVALARRSGAKLRVLSAAKERDLTETFGGGDALTYPTRYEELASVILVSAEQAVEAATRGVGDVEVEPDVSVGDPADFLIAASAQLDLLICGSRGYGPAKAVLLGGVSRRIVSEAHCPVIVLARGADSGLEALLDDGAPAG